jgi:hypothetical protein
MHSEQNEPRKLWELFVALGLLVVYLGFMWSVLH